MNLWSFRSAVNALGFGIMLILALGVDVPGPVAMLLLLVAIAAVLYGVAPFAVWLWRRLRNRWGAFMRPWRVTAMLVHTVEAEDHSPLVGPHGLLLSQESNASVPEVEDVSALPGPPGTPLSAAFHIRVEEPTQDRNGLWHVPLSAHNEGHGAVFRAEVVQLAHLVPSAQEVPWDLRWSGVEERDLLLAQGESQRLDLLTYKDMGFHWIALTEEHWGMCAPDGKPGFALVRLIRTEPGAYRDQWVKLTHASDGAMPGLSLVSRPDPEAYW